MRRRWYNFLRGMGAVLDIAPVRRPSRVGRGLNGDRTVEETLIADWERVAGDFQRAFRQVEREFPPIAEEHKRG